MGITESELNSFKAWKLRFSLPYYISNYPLRKFVGFGIRDPGKYDKQGLKPKVYLQFKDILNDLTPKVYLKFTLALSKSGFHGDSKVQLAQGVARFQYNNIVIHAASMEDARLSERVAMNFFKTKLESTSRGFDVKDSTRGGKIYDWNTFLCTQGLNRIPVYGTKFVAYED